MDKNQIEEEPISEKQDKPATNVSKRTRNIIGQISMKLQDVIRGYLDRRRIKEISRTKSITMLFDSQVPNRKVNFYEKSASTENEGETNLLNSIVVKVEKKLGTFNCGSAKSELTPKSVR